MLRASSQLMLRCAAARPPAKPDCVLLLAGAWVQVDDVFLSTRIYGQTFSYRSTPLDMVRHATWQQQLPSLISPPLVPGSNFK